MGNGSLVARWLSRKQFYRMGVMWGLICFAMAGLVSPGMDTIARLLGSARLTDQAYHFHTSSVLAATLGAGAFAVMALLRGKHIRHESLSTLFFSLMAYSVFAALLGGAGGFIIGWVKEIGDAVQGRYMDLNDVRVNWIAITRVVVPALGGALPVYLAAAFFCDAIRYALLRVFCPPKARKSLQKAHTIQVYLTDNAAHVKKNTRQASTLRGQIEELEVLLATTPADEKHAAKRKRYMEAMQEKQAALETLTKRISELETENAHLRHDLEKLSAESGADNPLVNGEIGQMLLQANDHEAQMCAARQQANAALARLEGALRACRESQTYRPAVATEVAVPDTASPSLAAPCLPEQEPLPQPEAEHRAPAPPVTLDTLAPEPEEAHARCELLERESKLQAHQIVEMEATLGALRGQVESLTAQLTDANVAIESARRERSRWSVLIVDDDHRILRVMKETLNATGRINAVTADSVAAALSWFREHRDVPDLILLDILMPKVSGTEFRAVMEKSPSLSKVPVVFCSGCAPESIENLDELPHEAYIRKPFQIAELQRIVLNALEKTAGASSA